MPAWQSDWCALLLNVHVHTPQPLPLMKLLYLAERLPNGCQASETELQLLRMLASTGVLTGWYNTTQSTTSGVCWDR